MAKSGRTPWSLSPPDDHNPLGPAEIVEGLRVLLRGGTAVADIETSLTITRSLPHGSVAAVLGTLQKLGLDQMIDREESAARTLVVAMITARILAPASKLATPPCMECDPGGWQRRQPRRHPAGSRGWTAVTRTTSMPPWTGWSCARTASSSISRRAASSPLISVWDLTSVWMEGRHSPLAKRGPLHDDGLGRDGKTGTSAQWRVCRYTASGPCLPISAPSPATPSSPVSRMHVPSG